MEGERKEREKLGLFGHANNEEREDFVMPYKRPERGSWRCQRVETVFSLAV